MLCSSSIDTATRCRDGAARMSASGAIMYVRTAGRATLIRGLPTGSDGDRRALRGRCHDGVGAFAACYHQRLLSAAPRTGASPARLLQAPELQHVKRGSEWGRVGYKRELGGAAIRSSRNSQCVHSAACYLKNAPSPLVRAWRRAPRFSSGASRPSSLFAPARAARTGSSHPASGRRPPPVHCSRARL